MSNGRKSKATRGLFSKRWNVIHNPEYLLRAVINTFETFRREGKHEPASDVFAVPAYMEEYALPYIRERWASISRCDRWLFPWHMGAVYYTWSGWRKATKKTKLLTLARLKMTEWVEQVKALKKQYGGRMNREP